jgi:arginase
MSPPTLVASPYHLGRRNFGLGSGVPVLASALAQDCDVVEVELPDSHSNEIAGSFAVVRAIAAEVARVEFPIVVAGNCSSSLGTVTGIGGGVGVIWFDAHGDFHTPETTPTGFFDGMPLAILTGRGWDSLRRGLATIPAAHVVHVAGRDFDEGERESLEGSGARIVRRTPIDDALDGLRREVDSVYVHVDLDVLDPSVGRANELWVDDGLSMEDLTEAIDAIHERFVVRAAALTAYEPAYDLDGTIPAAAQAIFERLTARARA